VDNVLHSGAPGPEPIGRGGHHVIFDRFERTPPRTDATYDYNFMGASIAHEFERDLIEINPEFDDAAKGLKASGRSALYDGDPTYPYKNSEDYFEWIDLLTAIDRADAQFTMIEIGAGYGRWIANAAAALRRRRNKPPVRQKFVGIESDKARFEMLVRNCANNKIAESELQLIRSACTSDDSPAFMRVSDDYGAAVRTDSKIAARFASQQAGQVSPSGYIENVPTLHLNSLLQETIDFVDMDIQGAELDVVPSCIDALDEFVKMIHIGTHSPEVDARLPHIFKQHGWRARRIFACGAVNQTPYGTFPFIDGMQSWENPRFD
jgi:FkbM family methyltransferase